MVSTSTKSNNFLWEEYRILQEKVDKLGAFKFQIKSWTITVLTGALFVAKASDIPWWAYFSGVLPIAAFHVFELKQRGIERAYISRLTAIEKLLRAESSADFFRVQDDLPYAVRRSRAVPSSIGEALKFSQMKKRGVRAWIIQRGDGFFYFIMYVMVPLSCSIALWVAKHHVEKDIKAVAVAPADVTQSQPKSSTAPNLLPLTSAPASMSTPSQSAAARSAGLMPNKVQPTGTNIQPSGIPATSIATQGASPTTGP